MYNIHTCTYTNTQYAVHDRDLYTRSHTVDIGGRQLVKELTSMIIVEGYKTSKRQKIIRVGKDIAHVVSYNIGRCDLHNQDVCKWMVK